MYATDAARVIRRRRAFKVFIRLGIQIKKQRNVKYRTTLKVLLLDPDTNIKLKIPSPVSIRLIINKLCVTSKKEKECKNSSFDPDVLAVKLSKTIFFKKKRKTHLQQHLCYYTLRRLLLACSSSHNKEKT